MAYLPKSKINIKEATQSDEFITKSQNKSYIGPYIETSNGRYFAGTNITKKGEEIIKKERTATNFGDSTDFKKYTKIKSSPYNFLVKTKPIPAFKNVPTEKDYKRGYYNRYFSARVNQQFGYQEISFKTYKSINSENEEYDHYLHDVGLIKWALNENVYQTNQNNLKTLERTFPFISNLFSILNEFHRPTLQVQTNLDTEGGELYYINGTEYIGPYHIHPTEGPMVGEIHTQSSHPKLYYSDQIPLTIGKKDTTDEDYEKHLKEKRIKDKKNWKKSLNKKQLKSEKVTTREGTRASTAPMGSRTSIPSGRGQTSRASSGGRGDY